MHLREIISSSEQCFAGQDLRYNPWSTEREHDSPYSPHQDSGTAPAYDRIEHHEDRSSSGEGKVIKVFMMIFLGGCLKQMHDTMLELEKAADEHALASQENINKSKMFRLSMAKNTEEGLLGLIKGKKQ